MTVQEAKGIVLLLSMAQDVLLLCCTARAGRMIPLALFGVYRLGSLWHSCTAPGVLASSRCMLKCLVH